MRRGVHVHAAAETSACDANGNVSDYVSSSGVSVAHYECDPFGNALSAGGPLSATFPHRFSTKYLDVETGLYYYGYRFYSPELGRWLSRDPIREAGGMNLYAYVVNDPVDMYDPYGLWVVKVTDKDGKEIQGPDDIAIEQEGIAGAGEFIDKDLHFVRDPAEVAKAIDALLKGKTVPRPPSCAAAVALRITVGAAFEPKKGSTVYYASHYYRGGMLEGGKGFNASSKEVLAHEKAHAKVWFDQVKKEFFDYLRTLDGYGKPEVAFTEAQEDAINKKYDELIRSQRYLDASGNAANAATQKYYDTNPSYRRLTAPNNLPYFPRIDRGNGDFMDPTAEWQVTGSP